MRKQTLDTLQPVEYSLSLPGVARNFTVTGPFESVQPNYEAAQAIVDSQPVQSLPELPKAAHRASETVKRGIGSVAANLEVALYDRQHGTRFGDELAKRKQLERDIAMARKLGLLSVE